MKKIIALLVILAAVGLVGFRVYDAYKTKAAGPVAGGAGGRPGGASAMRVPLVDAVSVAEGTMDDRISLIGSLRPIAEVQVMSKIAGRVEKVLVDVGDPVHEGQLMAQVEDREIQQQIRQAEAALAVVRATIQQREAELANVTRQVRRYQELHEQNLISRQELEDLTTREQSAEAQLELGRAQARQAEANVEQFKINLENTRSYSPMTGFVSKRHIHPGALVTANTPIVNLVDLRTLRTVINVVERDIVRVNRGVPAQIIVDAFPGRTFTGKVLRVSPVMDPATRTGEVEVHVSNPQLDLRAEMFARVVLDLGTQRRGMLVPREAIVYRDDQSGVFILGEGTVTFRPVGIGLSQQSHVEIVKGLQLGEKIVTMGASLLKEGDRVRLRSEEGSPSKGSLRSPKSKQASS